MGEEELVDIDTIVQPDMVNPTKDWYGIPELQEIQPENNTENWQLEGLPTTDQGVC